MLIIQRRRKGNDGEAEKAQKGDDGICFKNTDYYVSVAVKGMSVFSSLHIETMMV